MRKFYCLLTYITTMIFIRAEIHQMTILSLWYFSATYEFQYITANISRWTESHRVNTFRRMMVEIQGNTSFIILASIKSVWWRHQMEIFSALLAICAGNSPVTGEFPTQRPVTRSFDVYFDLRPNERLSKQSWGWWFETLSRSLWRHRKGLPHRDPAAMRFWSKCTQRKFANTPVWWWKG